MLQASQVASGNYALARRTRVPGSAEAPAITFTVANQHTDSSIHRRSHVELIGRDHLLGGLRTGTITGQP